MALSETNQKILAAKRAAADVQDYIPTPNLAVPSANSTAQVYDPSMGPLVTELAGGFAQGVARGFMTTGGLINDAARNPTTVTYKNLTKIDPNTVFGNSESAAKVGRIVFGDEEMDITSEGDEFLKVLGLEEGTTPWKSGTLMALLSVADLFGGSGSGIRGAVRTLEGVNNAADAAKVLRSIGFEEDIVTQYAPVFAATRTSTDTTAALEAAAKFQTTSRRVETTPIRTLDDADVLTVGGKVLRDEVIEVRDILVKFLDEVGNDYSNAIKADLLKGEVPSLRQFRAADDFLKASGIESGIVSARLADIRATVKTEPQRFLDSDFVRGGSVPEEGTVFLTPNTVDGENYARGYTLKEGAKTGTLGDLNTANIPNDVRIFSAEKAEDIAKLRETAPEAAAAIESAVGKGGLDWQVAVKYTKEIEDAGFGGVRMVERPAGSPVFDGAGKQVTTSAPIESVAVFDAKKVNWTGSKKALDEVANPLKENLGMLNVNLQERYGKAAITKSKAEKFAANEKKVFFEIQKYLEEVRYVAENGGEMVQTMPKWIPTELREMTVLDNVMQHLQDGTLPVSHASKEMALYTTMVDEVARRSGVKTKPLQAVDAPGAIVESMREGTRKAGSKKNPVVKGKVIPEDAVDDADMFESGDPLSREYSDEMAANEGYNEYVAMKNSPKRPSAKSNKAEPPYGLKLEGEVEMGELSDFKSVFRDMYRNTEKLFGEQWPKLKTKLFDPFDAAKGRMVAEEKTLVDAAYKTIVSDLGIKKGSKESAAVMDLGEGVLSYDEIVTKFGDAKAAQIKEAAGWFRAQYDSMIDQLNAVETALGKEPTPKRADYFRHYQEMSDGWTGAKNAFEDPGLGNMSPGKLNPEDSRKAKGKWASFKQRRLGEASKRDAVGGFLDYVPQYVYAKHIDPQMAKFREFARDLLPYKDTSPSMAAYINGLEKWTDDLAGQANFVDRFAEYAPGGKRGLNVVDYVNKRAKRNAILGNFGASISQIFNVPGGIASAGVYSGPGLVRSLGDIMHYGDGTAPWNASQFVMERYRQSSYDKFNVGLLENGKGFASWMITVLDEAGTKFIWNSHYDKALRQGIPNPVKYADDLTRKVVAGRGVGEVPVLQKSKVFQVVAPFQLEVMNQWWLMKDFVDEKQFGKLATLFAAYYVFNQASEEIKGNKVGFDPLQAFYDSYKIMTEEGQVNPDGTPADLMDRTKLATGRVAGEVLSSVPFGGYITTLGSRIAGMDADAQKEFFGEADPVRFGNAPLIWNSLTDPLFGILPSWGGAQMEKTFGGIRALAENKVRDKNGVVMSDLPVEPGVQGALRNILFGQYAPNFEYRDDVEREIRSLYHENEVLMENGQVDLVKQNLTDLPKQMQDVYRTIAKEEKAKEFERQKQEMEGTYDIVTALVEQGKTAEAKAILSKFTPEEEKVYRALHSDIKSAAAEERRDREKEHIIRTSLDYAYAFGTNPIQAYEVVFKNHEIIEDTVAGFSGVVRTRRIHFTSADSEDGVRGSDEIKEAMMKDEGIDKDEKGNYSLEHKVPLGIGGSNMMENLDLVPKAQHDAWTEVEIALIEAVKAKQIDYQKAQELILRHKGYAGEPITFEEIQAIINGN